MSFFSAIGQALGFVGNTVAQVASGDIGGAISNVAKAIDTGVKTGIPGGWGTVAAVTAATMIPGVSTAIGTAASNVGTQLASGNLLGAGSAAVKGVVDVGSAIGTGLFGGETSGVIPAGTSVPGGTASVVGLEATNLSNAVASQGLLGGLVTSVANFTGLSPQTVASLGSAGVQALLSSYGAQQTAEQQQKAAQTVADAQIRAAQIAAEAAKFRPVGVTTRFGQSAFRTDAQGNVIGAGYTPSQEILGYQNRLSALANQGLTQAEQAPTMYQPLTGAAQSLFSLGQGYLRRTPEEVAADYIAKQQALLAPSQEQQLALLQNKLQAQGRGGLAVAQGGTLGATSPELQAYYNALAQSNLTLAAQAEQEARNRITYGAGLFDTGAGLMGKYYTGQTAAYQPFATAMDTSIGLENLAQQPLSLGTQIGARTTAGTAESGRLLSSGITSAAQTMYPSQAFSATGQVLSGLASSPLIKSGINQAFGVQTPQQQTFTFNPTTGQYIPVQAVFS